MKRPGHTIIEVVISIGILAVATVSVGSLIDSLRTTDRATTNKTQASALAQQGLEIATAIARQEFQYSGTCTPVAPYTSCWNSCPTNVPSCTSTTIYQLQSTAGIWSLASGAETIGVAPTYTRELTITPVNGDQQVKQINAKVSWTEKTRTREYTLSTIVSAWKN